MRQLTKLTAVLAVALSLAIPAATAQAADRDEPGLIPSTTDPRAFDFSWERLFAVRTSAPEVPAGQRAAAGTEVYAVVGDSIAAGELAGGVRGTGFPELAGVQSAAYPGRCLVRRCWLWNPMIGDLDVAVNGAEWTEPDTPAMSPRPTTLIVEMGVNDMNTGSWAASVISGMKLTRDIGKEMGIRVVFATVIPPGKDFPSFKLAKTRRDQVNEWVRKQPAYLDLDKVTSNKYGQMLWGFNSGDDLHPNQAGQDAMAAELKRFMKADQAKQRKK